MFALRAGLTLCLASGSPRRRALLGSLGFPFQVCKPACTEPAPLAGENAAAYASRMAAIKTHAAPQLSHVLIAADTVVCINGQIMGKPGNTEEALAMLRKLNGREHKVSTAVHILLANGESSAFCEESTVAFGLWPDTVLKAYAATDEPLDKAGAYAIQGKGAFLVERVNGSFTNVVGLPLARLVNILLEKNVLAPQFKDSPCEITAMNNAV